MASPHTRRSRRQFLKHAGLGTLAFCVGGCEVEMTPREARDAALPYGTLTDAEVAAIEALGEILVPGSTAAGLAHFIDQQLGAPAARQLLMIRYLGVEPPFAPFYQAGLDALDMHSAALHGAPFEALDAEQQLAIVGEIAQSQPDGWTGPPAPFFYFVMRADAVDVVFGTPDGFAALDTPYMAHIEPPPGWDN